MKLRWSNGRDYADVFDAVDEETFIANGLAALRVFRLATHRQVHRGEIHRNELWFDHPELHVQFDGDRWMSPGTIKRGDRWSYFDPFRVLFLHNTAGTIDEINAADAAQLTQSASRWWAGCVDAYRWSGALDAMLMTVDDVLRRLTEEKSS